MTTTDTQNTPPPATAMQPVYIMQGNNKQSVDDEIDLRELWNALWDGKTQIAAITLVFAIASIATAFMLPNIYR